MWKDSDITGGKIRLKHSSTVNETIGPGGLVPGEVAINVADGILYYRKANGTVGSITISGLTDTINFTDGSADSHEVIIADGLIVQWSVA